MDTFESSQIAKWLKAYRGYDKGRLISIQLTEVRGPQRVAAELLLKEMDAQEHEESLKESRKANRLAILAIIIALAALALSAFQVSR